MNRFCYQCGNPKTHFALEFYGEPFCDCKCFDEFRRGEEQVLINREIEAAERIGILCDFKETQ